MGKYDDMLSLPHHVSKKHPQMSMHDRAAQFSPFAALTGYQSVLRETERLTERRVELSEEVRALLDERLRLVVESIQDRPLLSFTYFQPDERKDGGAYLTVTGAVKKVDEFEKTITMIDGTLIPIEEVFSVNGELFADMDWER